MTENVTNPERDAARMEDRSTQGPADAELLTRISQHDEAAMALLFDRYAKIVYSVALRVLHDPSEAEDVMQDVLMQVWRGASSFIVGRGSLMGWLAVVARNRAIDVLRRRHPSDPVDEVILPTSVDLAGEAERNTLMEKLRVIIRELPEEQQKSLELAFFEGMTHSEIAEKTGDPLGTVKTRIRLALISIRKALQA
ncbi:MAG TPA: sigma-70 family RNA polymerase sigma factor [Alloacidobacterium sp.]|jgi:RNA polymerase sigma-70 factor (ECF subfamily)|nr:sigma-70 family RNA polymerase sigma factor [Alloacidobacterium sp.]